MPGDNRSAFCSFAEVLGKIAVGKLLSQIVSGVGRCSPFQNPGNSLRVMERLYRVGRETAKTSANHVTMPQGRRSPGSNMMLQVSDAQMFQLGRQHTASASTLQLIADFHRFGPQYQVRCCLRVQCNSLVKATLRLEPGIDFQTPHAADLDDPEVLRRLRRRASGNGLLRGSSPHQRPAGL